MNNAPGKRSYTPIAQIDKNLGRRSLTSTTAAANHGTMAADGYTNPVPQREPNLTSSTMIPQSSNTQSPGNNNNNPSRTTTAPWQSVNCSQRRQSTGQMSTSQTSLDKKSNGSPSQATGSIDLKIVPLRKARNREFRINPDGGIEDVHIPSFTPVNGQSAKSDNSPVHEARRLSTGQVSPPAQVRQEGEPSPVQSSPVNEPSPPPMVKSSSILEKLSIFEKPNVQDPLSLQSVKPVVAVKPKSPPGQQSKLKDGNGVYWADVLKPSVSRSNSHQCPKAESTDVVVDGQGHSHQGNGGSCKLESVTLTNHEDKAKDSDTVSTRVSMSTRTQVIEQGNKGHDGGKEVLIATNESTTNTTMIPSEEDKIMASSGPSTTLPSHSPSLDHQLLPSVSQDNNQEREQIPPTLMSKSPIFLPPLAQDSLKNRLIVSTNKPTPTEILQPAVTPSLCVEGVPTMSSSWQESGGDGEVPQVVESEMEMLNDLLKYINQKIVSLSPSSSSSDGDSDSGIKGNNQENNGEHSSLLCNDGSDQNDCYNVRNMSLDDTIDGSVSSSSHGDNAAVVKRKSINGDKRRSRTKSLRENTIVDNSENGDNGLTDEGIVVGTNLNPSSGDSLDQVLDMTFFKSTPDGKKKTGHHDTVAGQRRSPSTEPSGHYSLTTTTTDEEEEEGNDDGDDESSLEDRLDQVGINDISPGNHPIVVTIRSPGLVGRNDSSRSNQGKKSPLISFNDLSVIEIESFLKKHRRTDQMKDEGNDTILYLPDFIQNAMNFLIKHGIRKEGIFRRSGVKSRINLLVQNHNSSLNNLDHACPYDVADFLKGWFRNQVPLLPASLVSTLLPLLRSSIDTLTTPSSSSSSSSPTPSNGHNNRTNTMKSNGTCDIPDINKLTPDDLNRLRAHLMVFPNRLAIESLFRFLYKMSQYSDYSSMTISNLAIVWTPSLCREESASMASIVSMSPVSKYNKNKGSKSDHSVAGSLDKPTAVGLMATKMTPSRSVSSNNFLLESVSNFMKDSRILVEFLITNIDTLFCISRTDLVLPSPPVSVHILPSSGTNSAAGHNHTSRPASKASTIDSRNGGSLRLSSFAANESVDTYQPRSSIPRGIRPPSIGCKRMKIIPNASPYDIFLRIILERRTWDPLVTEIIDEGSGVQKIKHNFSQFLRPSSSATNGGSLRTNGQNRYARCKSLTRSTNSPCHRRSVSTSSSDSRRRTSSRGSSLTGHNDCDQDDCSDSTRYLTIKRKWPDKLDPSVQVIQIHEESLDDPSSRTKTSTGMPSYFCDWSIKLGPQSSVTKSGIEQSSEISVSMYADMKGRPFCWYTKSFPRLIDCYLNRISSFFNDDQSTLNHDGLLDVVDTNVTFGGHYFQSRGQERTAPRAATFDPFCCISMKHVVQA